jgi:hypothetical protein
MQPGKIKNLERIHDTLINQKDQYGPTSSHSDQKFRGMDTLAERKNNEALAYATCGRHGRQNRKTSRHTR